MLQRLNFFAPPIHFNFQENHIPQKILEFIDGYFYLGDMRAFVIKQVSSDDPSVVLGRLSSPKDRKEKTLHLIATAMKIASYFAIIIFANNCCPFVAIAIPVIVLALRIGLRCYGNYQYTFLSKLPKFADIFKSKFYSNTFVSPVDFSNKAIQQDLLVNYDKALNVKAQRLFCKPELAKAFAAPLCYEEGELVKINQLFADNGFKILSSKYINSKVQPFYSVLEHPAMPGWIIKSCARRVPKNAFIPGLNNDINELALFSKNEGLMRIEMAKRIQKAAKELGIDLVIPIKKLVEYPKTTSSKPEEKYFLVCQKLNILSVEETYQKIEAMSENEQKAFAQTLVKLTKKTGAIDLSFDNLRFTKDGRLALIDTEPGGLMRLKKKSFWRQFFADRPSSVEKCARIGLYCLWTRTNHQPALKHFNDECKRLYDEYKKPPLSRWKIALSIVSLGLYSNLLAISAFVQTQRVELLAQDVQLLCNDLQQEPNHSIESLTAFNRKIKLETKKFTQFVNGTPY